MLINIERTAFLEVNSLQKYKKLFFSTFELSACTFGGGFVIIPLMRKKFVEELGWIEEDEMMDLSKNIPLEDALDLGWKILADCFEPSETGIKSALVEKYWPKKN